MSEKKYVKLSAANRVLMVWVLFFFVMGACAGKALERAFPGKHAHLAEIQNTEPGDE